VDYVEDMLKQQLIQAIGKEIVTKDFDQFMRFHNQKLLGSKYAPTSSYSIQKTDIIRMVSCRLKGRQKNEPVSTHGADDCGTMFRPFYPDQCGHVG
jgi:hypothetical protein